jgi:Fe-S-cluster containining protein
MRYAVIMRSPVPPADQHLVQIVDAALAEAARKSGEWLACRPGCTQCCIGPFPISQLDAARLRQGLTQLKAADPQRAARVRQRAHDFVLRFATDFPGDPQTGILAEGEEAEARFADFANDEPCPALDPGTGMCDLYSTRPMTCRTFGPPVRSGVEGGLGVCELCYHGASDEEIAACEMKPDPDNLETKLVRKLEKTTGVHGNTIVAFCLVDPDLTSAT